MQLIARPPTHWLAATALLGVAVGAATERPVVVMWCALLLITAAALRASLAYRIWAVRRAGFNMAWCTSDRTATVSRMSDFSLMAELINRGSVPLVLEDIRVLHNPALEVRVSPRSALLPAGSRITLSLSIRPLRIGTAGIQGFVLLVGDAGSGFQVPLSFQNPFVLSVLPLDKGRLGLGQLLAPGTRPWPGPALTQRAGDALELRELRDYMPGDPRRSVASLPSARRGRLLVVERELEERETIELILDASVELWAGKVGESMLDQAIDRLAGLSRRALSLGHHVGLTILGTRVLGELEPRSGLAQQHRILHLLAAHATSRDADRSGLDRDDAAAMVVEHLCALDPSRDGGRLFRDRERLAQLAVAEMAKMPHPPQKLLGHDPLDRTLREYLAVFGHPSPTRLTADRAVATGQLAQLLSRMSQQKISQIVICGPMPEPMLLEHLTALGPRFRRSKIGLSWLPMELGRGTVLSDRPIERLVATAFSLQIDHEISTGLAALRRVRVRVPRLPSSASAFISPHSSR